MPLSLTRVIPANYLRVFAEEAPADGSTVICVSSLIQFAKLSHHFGPVRSGLTFVPNNYCSYQTHYRSAFAYSNLLYLQSDSSSYDSPSFVAKGAFQAYHVPPLEHVDLAACYGPEDILMTTKKLTPSFFHTFNITVSAI